VQIHHKPSKIAVTGASGTGKTTYVIRYIKNTAYDHVIIYDHKLEFLQRENIQPEFSREQLVERVIKGEKWISYNHMEDFPGESQAGFEWICEWSYEIAKLIHKRVLFVCDEFNRFTDTHSLGWEFTQLIEDGRLQGLDFIGTAHAGNQIHNRLRLQLTEIVAFNTKDSTPLAFLEENGFDIVEIQQLRIPGEFITKDCVNTKFVRGNLFSLTDRRKSIKLREADGGETLEPDTGEESEIKTEHG
jgi:GTPase SAR1 family protein